MLPKNISDKTCIFVNFLKNMNFDFFLDFCQKHNQKHPGNAPKDRLL